MKLERLNVNFEIKQILEDVDDGFFRFEGLASTFGNIDLVKDTVAKGAFVDSIRKIIPKILWQHSTFEPIGMPEILQEVDDGLFVRARLPKEDTFVSGRVIPQLKVGSISAMSIGFTIPEGGAEMLGDGRRLLKKIDLKEISLVSFPADQMALVSGFKSSEEETKTVTPFQNLPVAPNDRVWDASAAVSRVRQATGSTEAPSASYKNNFMWFDSADSENFGAYKLPFVDVVNGKRTVIPRAVNNAKARLNQTDIPAADKTKVLTNINKYQEKFSKSFYDVEDVKKLTPRELENALRDSGVFSKKAATFLSSTLDVGEPKKEEQESDLLAELLVKADKHLQKNAFDELINKVNNYAS